MSPPPLRRHAGAIPTGDVLLDGEFSPSIVVELARMGHKAERADDAYFYGSAKAF